MTIATTNASTNITTRSIVLSCQCKNSEFLTTTSYELPQDRCLSYNDTVSDCCLTDSERGLMVP